VSALWVKRNAQELMSVQSNVIYNLNLQSKAVYCRFLQKQKTLLNVKKYK